MNKIYQKVINDLSHYSEKLTKTSLFINKPWALIDGDNEIQKLIFKKDRTLVISKNGNASIGKWDYFPEAKSILIDRGRNKLLCKEGFIDEGLLVLLKDGTDNQFFVLVNENIVPNLDPFEYIQNLRTQYFRVKFVKLENGKMMGIHPKQSHEPIHLGCRVEMDMTNVEDGVYKSLHTKKEYNVENSRIAEIYFITDYQSTSGETIIIRQEDQFSKSKGDYVFINEKPAPSGKYKIKGSSNFRVENGVIVKKSWF